MSVTMFFIIYAIGVILNALMAASVWDDLADDGRLVRVRRAVLAFFVLASFATWIYAIGCIAGSLVHSMFKRKTKEKEQGHERGDD